ncbi:hypothetical protein OSB04_024999 [Centaurea solstitialis]|uniref:HIRAN domain-containing protein n=1 Tax=Centaurea solstitialis TaxID=347529 RepID=A0AA38T5Q6_9ASTR|nr:hypothetical protein OSB04_024999 [Centaurea solstitialis]
MSTSEEEREDINNYAKPFARTTKEIGRQGLREGASLAEVVGRLPMDWSKCLIPLVNSKKVKVLGRCVAAPVNLCMMQEIMLYISVYIHHSIFTEDGKTSWKLDANPNIASTIYPLLTLFKPLKKSPFQKAEFTPEELDSRKRVLNLEEMNPPTTVTCDLRPYQKQALYWMTESEKGVDIEKAEETLHPCWAAYRICDEYAPPSFYHHIYFATLSKLLRELKQILYGNSEAGPVFKACAQPTQEFFKENTLRLLIVCLPKLNLDLVIDNIMSFAFYTLFLALFIDNIMSFAFYTPRIWLARMLLKLLQNLQRQQVQSWLIACDYLQANIDLMDNLATCYENPDMALHYGAMLRECICHQSVKNLRNQHKLCKCVLPG